MDAPYMISTESDTGDHEIPGDLFHECKLSGNIYIDMVKWGILPICDENLAATDSGRLVCKS